MDKVIIIQTITKTFNIHDDKRCTSYHETDLYAIDQFSSDELKDKGLYLVSTHENVEVVKGE